MTTAIFGSMLDVESGVPTPKPAYYSNSKSRDYGLPSPTPLKLDELQWNAVYTGPATPEATAGTRTPANQGDEDQTTTPGDRFGFQPSQEHLASEALQSWSQGANKWRVLSACVVYFNNGLSDSAPGALLPYMEDHYHISYSIVSLVFVAQALGFLTAAFFNEMIKNKIGYAKTYALSEFLLVVAYAIIVATPPYPVVVFTYFLVGLAASANNALSNVFCANLASSTVVLGAAQGAYGLGGTIGPIIATLIVSRGAIWSKYYFLTLGTCMFGGIVSFWSFRGFENERSNQLMSALERQAASQATSKRTLLAQALRYSVTIIGALFTFAYQGAEVSISGWVISFLITERQGDPGKVGYVSAGFWGGITLGRFTLSPIAQWLGEKRFVFALGLLAAVFQLVVWLVPNIIGDSIAVALVGYVLGPIAPVSMVMFLRLLPRSIQTLSTSFISSAGSSGGAVWPFLTGLIAQSKGTYVLHPVCIALFALMLGCWWMLPSIKKREE